jgi:CheY-like chemotaxis protein
VVDDEAYLRGMLNTGMRQQGFAVWLAASGPEALELYRRHHETIHVTLLDVHMPGLDGPQTLLELQQVNPQIRCCFLSGDPGSYTEGQLCTLGAVAVFRKPFRPDELALALWELAGEAERRPFWRMSSGGSRPPLADKAATTTRQSGPGSGR